MSTEVRDDPPRPTLSFYECAAWISLFISVFLALTASEFKYFPHKLTEYIELKAISLCSAFRVFPFFRGGALLNVYVYSAGISLTVGVVSLLGFRRHKRNLSLWIALMGCLVSAGLAMRILISAFLLNALVGVGYGRPHSHVATHIVSTTFSSGSTDFSATTNGALTTYTWLTTNEIVTTTDGRLITNRYAVTNTLVWTSPVKDVSTNNGVVLTRTAIAPYGNSASDYDSVHNGEKAQATFSGGDGSTVKDAVVIAASSEEKGYRAADIWLHEHYPGSHLQDEGTDFDDSGRQFVEIKIVAADGKSHTVIFETTSFYYGK